MHTSNELTARRAAQLAWCALLGLSLLAVFATAAQAQAQEGEGEGPSFSVSAAYTGDWRRNTSGGLRTGSAYSDVVDLGLAWVADGLFSSARMTTNLSVMYLGGGDISGEYLGDLQGINNLEAANGWKLYESWVEFSFGDSSSTLRAGVLDLNAEFDTPVTQGIFTASPFGIGTDLSQSGARGPACWPTTGLGLRADGEFGAHLRWRFAAFDGAPGNDEDSFTSTRLSADDGALLAAEIEYSSERMHKLAFGYWRYTADFARLDAALLASPAEERGNQGFYAHLDARLGSLGPVDFDAALRAGQAAARFNAVERYAGLAFTVTHLVAARPDDSLGLGVAHARLGHPYRAMQTFDGRPTTAAETTFELVYHAELTPWLAVLPLVQFVRAPGADPLVDDSWIAGLRFELGRERTWPLSARRVPEADGTYAQTE